MAKNMTKSSKLSDMQEHPKPHSLSHPIPSDQFLPFQTTHFHTYLHHAPPTTTTPKTALLLGAGHVCLPTIAALTTAGLHLTIASRTLSTAQTLCTKYPDTTTALPLTLPHDTVALSTAISKADIIISLLPYTHHALVIQAAITHQKPVVTTSYISPALWALHAQAKNAGVTILNEIGLDPGIDHLYAVKTIEEVHREGGKVRAFESWCGAIPAPESAEDNPLGYKFSWSPRGGLLALVNEGRWIRDGEVVRVEGRELMRSARVVTGLRGVVDGEVEMEGYPNRDATGFRNYYGIPEARTVFRGTLRYRGFAGVVGALVEIGFLGTGEMAVLKGEGEVTWLQLTGLLLGMGVEEATEGRVRGAVAEKVASFLNDDEEEEEEVQRVIDGLEWIGLFDADRVVDGRGTPLDTLCAVLEQRMAYEPGERDMIVLQHVFEIERADGSTEKRTSTLVEYGEPLAPGSRSAMAKLVGLPCAVGVLAVLDGRITEKGMVAPWTTPEIATLLREDLKERFGIELEEKVVG
ncbi:Saccharopine dehydrogenase [Aspergillus sclerotiicarbonarius CBS 121057]|uniref:Saccharopine dehydrogenase n=1 Tax=Aspergillus sclerotiicarbonarius (strain CBS 121057 / IBT 28362) TaxID=1448318 RepID=A0A319EK85_ASPSB|nr:Saccharopine dehydrogenase [Aspergillus sclerotiicarbonarius CBS 121057]